MKPTQKSSLPDASLGATFRASTTDKRQALLDALVKRISDTLQNQVQDLQDRFAVVSDAIKEPEECDLEPEYLLPTVLFPGNTDKLPEKTTVEQCVKAVMGTSGYRRIEELCAKADVELKIEIVRECEDRSSELLLSMKDRSRNIIKIHEKFADPHYSNERLLGLRIRVDFSKPFEPGQEPTIPAVKEITAPAKSR